jgi:hypothetical protein
MPRALTVATGETRKSLRRYHSSDGIVVMISLSVATKGYVIVVNGCPETKYVSCYINVQLM